MAATTATRRLDRSVVWTLRALLVFDLGILLMILIFTGRGGADLSLPNLNLGLATIPITTTLLTVLNHVGMRRWRSILCGVSRRSLNIRSRGSRGHLILIAFMTAQSWLVPASIGAVSISRQVDFLSASANEEVWRRGFACHLYHAITGMCFVMIIACLMLALLTHFQTKPSRSLASSDEKESNPSSTLSSVDFKSMHCCKRNSQSPRKLEYWLSDAEHDLWLQRRYSTSSLKAVFPRAQRTFDYPSLQRVGSVQSQLFSLSETGESSFSYHPSTSLSRSLGSSRYSMACSRSYCTKRSGPSDLHRRTPSTQRNTQSPGASIDLEDRTPPCRMHKPDRKHSISPPPPAWSPSIKHAPLSADPTIRALSTVQPDTNATNYIPATPPRRSPHPLLSPTASRTPSTAWTSTRSTRIALSPCPVRLPPRAPGHMVHSSGIRPLRRPSLISDRSLSTRYSRMSHPASYNV